MQYAREEYPMWLDRMRNFDLTLISLNLKYAAFYWVMIGVTRYLGSASEQQYSKAHQQFNERVFWMLMRQYLFAVMIVLCAHVFEVPSKMNF